jgi:hypothetical protein
MPEPKNWKRLALEGMVIVASILLAFGIQAGWEEWQEIRVEHRQVEALEEDFSQNLSLLTVRQSRLETSVGRITRLRDMLRVSPVGEIVVVPDSLLNELFYTGTIDPLMGTLDAMIGSGRLDQLPDPVLRYALTDWRRLVSDVRTNQVLAQDYVMLELVPYLATQGDFSHTLDTSETTSGETTITASPGLVTMISGKLTVDQWSVIDIAPLVERTREVSELLAALRDGTRTP